MENRYFLASGELRNDSVSFVGDFSEAEAYIILPFTNFPRVVEEIGLSGLKDNLDMEVHVDSIITASSEQMLNVTIDMSRQLIFRLYPMSLGLPGAL